MSIDTSIRAKRTSAVHEGGAELLNWLNWMLDASASYWISANTDYELQRKIGDECRTLIEAAYDQSNSDALASLHQILSFIYEYDFSSASLQSVDLETQPILRSISAILEGGIMKNQLALIRMEELKAYPITGAAYVQWLKKLISAHTSSIHPLYNQYLANEASKEDLAFFLAQETNLDPRFDDILAMLQIGLHGIEKMELACNYFDEMGNGNVENVHTVLFSRALKELNVDISYIRSNMMLEAQASGNISACLAMSRRHYYKAIGYFGVTEYLAPRRFKHFVAAWNRNGLSITGSTYHQLHIHIDAEHANGWMNNVISPLIDSDPAIGLEIAIGALIRLNSSGHYLDALLTHFSKKVAIHR